MHKRGVPVSPGVVVARAFCIDDVLARREPQHLDAAAVNAELIRFDRALQNVGSQLDAIIDRVAKQVGNDEAGIFRAHRILLRDPALVGKVKSSILGKKVDARSALQDALDDYTTLFSKIEDEYIGERLADIRDVVSRIIDELEQNCVAPECLQMGESVVLVSPEILPSQALWLQKMSIGGIITERGGSTGHAAILARSLGIPLVSGMTGILRDVVTGDWIAMDGREGHVHIKPDAETEAAYRKLQREYVHQREKLVENRDLPAITPDGVELELLANVNGPGDADMACRNGAVGVGLYRTEYLFLTHPTVPSEEEQLAVYRSVIEASPNKKITIRTLDIGGDKLVPYLAHHREANPFMGWRSIRLSTAYPEFFLTQLRAIFRAALAGNVSVMFPMISTFEEVRHVKRMVRQAKEQLTAEGIPFADNLPMGVMMEVPAAALCIDAILPEVDFISIGSNDLIQYVMAADRDNPRVAYLCEPFNPPVFRLLAQILRRCERAGKPVTLCGEMAARPRCVIPLVGMGLRKFSMSPAFVPTVKEAARNVSTEQARRIARRTLRFRTFRGVREYLTRVVSKLCPNLTFTDTKK
jgi:phosphotransferase system enzyme I (PtsI)